MAAGGPWAVGTALLAAFGVLALLLSVLVANRRRLAATERDRDGLRQRLRVLEAERDALQRAEARHEQLEHDLLQAKHEAEAAVLSKGEFLATMSHEIRTPLNGILPMLDLIGRGPLQADQRQMLATADTSSQQLLRIVDDILDYSRLEAQALQLESTPFHLRDLLEGVVQLMQGAAAAKGLALDLQVDTAVRFAVCGDPVRLRQVLGNLLVNAIKFTAQGQVTVRVQRMGETHESHQLRFEVIDTGIGIAPSQQVRLFDPFTQADASTTRVYGGTGLGLAICRRIIALMQGRIGVVSTPGSGATFWFEIPLRKIAGDIVTHGERSVLLYAADTRLQHRVARVAPQHGLRVQCVQSLAEALHAVRAPTRPGWPPLAWLVVNRNALPGNSADALRNAVQERRQREPLQVLWLHMGDAASLDGHHWRETIADDAELHALFASAERALQRPAPLLQAAEPVVSRDDDAPLGLRVLVVEDNTINLMVAQRLLEALGCTVCCAGDGEQALQQLQAAAVDCVLMDCQMPVLDGYAATRRWRALEQAQGRARLPIIAMTANAMAGDRARCLQAGMDDYLSKPIDADALRALLLRHAAAQGDDAAAGTSSTALPQGAAPDASLAVPAAATADLAYDPSLLPLLLGPDTTLAVLDGGVLDELHDVIGAGIHGIIDAFLHDTPELVRRLQYAAAADDQPQLRALAHSLKSSSANLGALALSAVAQRIEVEAAAGTLQRPVAHTARLVAEFARVRIALPGWRNARSR